MRSVLLRSLAVIGVGALVLAGVLYVASTVDARPPAVVEIRLTQPLADDARTALITTTLEIVFSEPIDQDGAADAISLEPAVRGAISWSGSTMIFTPSDPLELDTSYALTIGPGIRDVSGNEMSELPPPFEFATTGRPVLAEAAPADGSDDVPLEEPIGLTFSTLMDTASVEAELRLRPAFPHELRWSEELLEIVPLAPLRAGQDYEVTIQADATDVAGVALAEPITIRFRTVTTGLTASTMIPANGIEGVAPTSPIAVIFDRPLDPASVDDDLLTITPDLAGTLEVTSLPGDPAGDGGSGTILRFTPSSPMPPNTTFRVDLAQGLQSTSGGGLSGPISWTFTTGAPQSGISNQITYISERAGVANVWVMNPDGTGKRQLTALLTPVTDYAVAPDGSSLVVGDGRRLIFLRPNGSEQRVLTNVDALDFDPAYSPDGDRIAFARADAATGAGLGIWEWTIGGGDPSALELPPALVELPSPSPSGLESTPMRAPRYSPDGQSLAFVDGRGFLDLLELPGERLTRIPFAASSAPAWLPDSSGLLISGRRSRAPTTGSTFEGPVEPLEPGPGDDVFRVDRSATAAAATALPPSATVLAVSADGEIAYGTVDGSLWLTRSASRVADRPLLEGDSVLAASFEPGEERGIVVVIGDDDAFGSIERVDTVTGRRTELAPSGASPRWLP